MSDLCKCGHDATAHSFGHGDCGWTGGSRTALCPCMQFRRDDRGRPAGKSQGAASAGEPPAVSDALTAPADRDDLASILAKHHYDHPELVNGLWHVVCVCGESIHVPAGDNDHAVFRAHVAQMVLQSDWLRVRDAAKWDEGYNRRSGTPDCRIPGNPYRADPVNAEEGSPDECQTCGATGTHDCRDYLTPNGQTGE